MRSHDCPYPLVLVTFNRPDLLAAQLERLAGISFPRIYCVSDGPRPHVPTDAAEVGRCREMISLEARTRSVVPIFSETNLSLKRRFFSALDSVFEDADAAIILEDDCLPTMDFFRFVEWGLATYRDDDRVAMVSGSNLLADRGSPAYRNGYSNYINIWGWGGWRRTWRLVDRYLSVEELGALSAVLKSRYGMDWRLRTYWKNIIKHALYARTGWDFYLQAAFFLHQKVSVYPGLNLVENLGFRADATHTSSRAPPFVTRTAPRSNQASVMDLPVNPRVSPDLDRDLALVKTIWGYSALAPFRLVAGNIRRYASI